MTALNKPENTKTNPAHDLGQISIEGKTPEAHLNRIKGWITAAVNDAADTWGEDRSYYYLARARALEAVIELLEGRMPEIRMETPEIREGMAEFVGPLRKVYVWVGSHGASDPRAMTGTEKLRFSNFRRDFDFAIEDLDAPWHIAAGSTIEHIGNEDPDRNVFPETISRSCL